MAKRTGRPESHTKPRGPKSSWPKDRRPAAHGRGKSGSPLATGEQKRGGTSVGGKPTGDGEPSKIPSSDASRKPRTRPADPEAPASRKLSKGEIAERERRMWQQYGAKRKLERDKKRITADLSRDITALSKALDKLHDEIESGYEQTRQGELPLEAPDAAEVAAGSTTPTPGETNQALREVAKHVGGNGGAHDFAADDPKPQVADAGPTRMASDIERAAAADLRGDRV